MMSQTLAATASSRATDARAIGLIGAAHFVSHVYMLVLPPLFPYVKAEFNVSYTELGIVIAAFNIISAVLQTPAGFLVDRTSARAVLVGGLLIGSVALAISAMVSNFLVFGVMFALLGLANTVYHPADYALLSNRITPPRISQAFSIHIFAGFIGTALTPVTMIMLASVLGWRGAFLATAFVGVAVALALMLFGEPLAGRESARAKATSGDGNTSHAGDWRVLVTAPVLLNLLFFILISGVSVGVQNYSIVALEALWGTPIKIGTSALTAYLLCAAFAVLAGGWISARTNRHDLVAATGLALSGLALLPVAFFDLGSAFLLFFMGLSGLFNGALQPSRDMLVRQVTPPGAFGRVFGFVTTGFALGGVIAPPIFGYMMDTGAPGAIFVCASLASFAAIATVLGTAANSRRRNA